MTAAVYECDLCHGVFALQDEEEAIAERERLWPGETDFAIVCDDCFQEFMAWAVEEGVVEPEKLQ